MSETLLLLGLGPIQDFIAQARRTRDLWFGSHLLSEVARAAARNIADGGGRLVFPAFANDDPELQPCDRPLRTKAQRPPRAVANKVLAVIPGDVTTARAAACAAMAAAQARLAGLADEVREEYRELLAPGIDDVWDQQVRSALELLAAWAPIGAGGYAETRRALEAELAGRKALRDFRPWRVRRDGAHKSSLDGARDSVLIEGAAGHVCGRGLRLGRGERLAALGLLKRAGGDPQQFVPIANVALAGWWKHLESRESALASRLRDAAQANRLRLGRVNRRDVTWTEGSCDFELQVLLDGRLERVLQEVHGEERSVVQDEITELEAALHAAHAGAEREPLPYVAFVVADGDRMGRAINRLTTEQNHVDLSRALGSFAEQARVVVESKHLGCLVFAGGDDVLALVCLQDAVSCAGHLRRVFHEVLEAELGERLPADVRPTLSVGLGVGHVLAGMSELIDLARAAERLAKNQGRNALGVVVDKRSGGRAEWWSSWDDAPEQRLSDDVELLRGPLSIKKSRELCDVIAKLPEPEAVDAPDAWIELTRGELERVLDRSRLGQEEGASERLSLEELLPNFEALAQTGYGAVLAAARRFAARLAVARILEQANPESAQQHQEAHHD